MSDFPNAGGYENLSNDPEDSTTDTTDAPAEDTSSGAANPEGSDEAAELQGDPAVPNAGDSGRILGANNPDYTPDEEGYVGVDPIYRNSSDHKRRPAVGEGDEAQVPGAPADDAEGDEE